MSNAHLNGLSRSPYEDEPTRPAWWPLIAGVVVGAIAVWGILLMISGDDATLDDPVTAPGSPSAPGSSVPATTTTGMSEAGVSVEPPLFPDGYIAISETEAVKPHHMYRNGDQLFVSMTTSYARGVDATIEPLLLGGTWMLETASGETIESEGTVFDDNPIWGADQAQILGSLAAVFTLAPTTQPVSLQLVEEWGPVEHTESIRIPVDTWPFALPEPLAVPFEDFTLQLDTLYLETYGTATWTIGPDNPQAHRLVHIETAMIGPDGTQIATAEPFYRPPRSSGFETTPRSDLAIIPGRIVLDTAGDLGAFYTDELGQTQELLITITITTSDPVPTESASIDLTSVPILND